MKPLHVALILSALLICNAGTAKASEIDTELMKLAKDLSSLTTKNEKKKVTVLDFTDLQYETSELGRYIAEELTVDLVMTKSNFSVLDRANLKKILAEHKLTAQGLVDPENAKKIGQFAGVDALIIGTVIEKGPRIAVNAKILTTDTAEIVASAKAEFISDDLTTKLLAQKAKVESASDSKPPAPKLFGDLSAKIESVKLLSGDNVYGSAKLIMTITNSSPSKTYGIAFAQSIYDKLNLSNSRGDEFKATEVSGVETAFEAGDGTMRGAVTDIPPNSAITVTSKSQVRWTGKPGDYRPYRLQTTVFFGEEIQGRYPGLKKYNLVTEWK